MYVPSFEASAPRRPFALVCAQYGRHSSAASSVELETAGFAHENDHFKFTSALSFPVVRLCTISFLVQRHASVRS
jgi:hypothetical protein